MKLRESLVAYGLVPPMVLQLNGRAPPAFFPLEDSPYLSAFEPPMLPTVAIERMTNTWNRVFATWFPRTPLLNLVGDNNTWVEVHYPSLPETMEAYSWTVTDSVRRPRGWAGGLAEATFRRWLSGHRLGLMSVAQRPIPDLNGWPEDVW